MNKNLSSLVVLSGILLGASSALAQPKDPFAPADPAPKPTPPNPDGEAGSPPAEGQDRRDQRLVDQSGQDSHNYLEAPRIGHPQPPDETGTHPLPLHPFGDQLASAVDDHGPQALLVKGDDILQGAVRGAQGAPSDFDDYRPAAMGLSFGLSPGSLAVLTGGLV